ncbi:MAG TPA: FRG domain-containing protein, partial [Candidatus Nitrosocosmicus sp.]|nr:FRG domain-containing protein [Candidatus Nitrosocosmicus sp.]
MHSERELSLAWIDFLAEIEAARRELQCSHSPAWFRGHSNEKWPLRPSLFRYGTATDPEDALIQDRARRLHNERRRWRAIVELKSAARKELTLERKSTAKQEAYRTAADDERSTKASIQSLTAELERLSTPINGEREIFDEFVFRSGASDDESSWLILARMRHHGVPTRLLDWTDRLDIAIYFALDSYRTMIEQLDGSGLAPRELNKRPRPCIWVLNPFLLGQRATGRTAIWSLTRETDFDYYVRFLRERNWPFKEPMPIYPPSKLERVQSQRGFFTLFGRAKKDLDIQLREGLKCLRQIPLTPEAALFCLDYLTRVQGLSPFEV